MITTRKGLLWENGNSISLPEADAVARKHGFQYAEQMVRKLEQQEGGAMNEDVQIGQLKTQASGLVQWAEALTVAKQEDADIAGQKISAMAKIKKTWLAYWKPVKDQAKKTHSDICAKEKEGTDILDRARSLTETKILAWQRAEREKAEAEQRRLQAIADEQARKERERLEKEAAKLKTPEKKAERMEQAAAVVAPTVRVAVPVAKPSGVSGSKTWKARCVDMSALIADVAAKPNSPAAAFLAFDQSAANAFARISKGAVQIGGVVFEEIESLRASR